MWWSEKSFTKVALAGQVDLPHTQSSVTRTRPNVSVFFVIDVLLNSTDLREAARETWLQDVTDSGNGYRFFAFGEHASGIRKYMEDDLILIPFTERPCDRLRREFVLLRFAFQWTLKHSFSDFIVKVDPDMYVCVYHLAMFLVVKPKRLFFSGVYHSAGRCRADQNWLVYSRDALKLALGMMASKSPITWEENWALTWGRITMHLHGKANLTVEDDIRHVDGNPGFPHYIDPDALLRSTKSRNYCSTRMAYHMYRSYYKVDAKRIMKHLWSNDLTRLPVESIAQAHLKGPACFRNIDSSCLQDWIMCDAKIKISNKKAPPDAACTQTRQLP